MEGFFEWENRSRKPVTGHPLKRKVYRDRWRASGLVPRLRKKTLDLRDLTGDAMTVQSTETKQELRQTLQDFYGRQIQK